MSVDWKSVVPGLPTGDPWLITPPAATPQAYPPTLTPLATPWTTVRLPPRPLVFKNCSKWKIN